VLLRVHGFAYLAHVNLRDCYLYADGNLNTHAAGCGICQEERLSATT